jgi:hypothetical protein
MAGRDTRRHQPAGITAFRPRTRDAIGHPGMMARRGG